MSNIFVVDDSISVRKALELSLKREGMNVRSAASGEQALEKLRDEPFDLLIADVIMPGISGFELCQTLKKDPEFANIPVLIISGNVDADVKAEAHEAGAIGVLKKPFRQEELMPAVQKALASGAAHAAAAQPEPMPAPQQPQAPAATFTPTPATPAAQPQHSGSPFATMLERAVNSSGTSAAAMISPEGEVLDQRGEPLPPSIGQYARFYMGTAQALAGQLHEQGRPQLELELGSKRLSLRSLGDNILLTLGRL